MKRLLNIFILVMVLLLSISSAAFAVTDYTFSLSASNTSSVEVGDVIRVTLTLANNSDTDFTMYSMQDYIIYDSDYFSYVSDSEDTADELVISFPELSDSDNSAIRVSYLSLDGNGIDCDASTVLVSFKLKALQAGSTTISHYLTEMSSRNATLYTTDTVDTSITIKPSSGSSGHESSGGSSSTTSESETEENDESALDFSDVAEDNWYFDAVKFVVNNGLFNGVSDKSFEPQTNMTRGMLVTVLYRMEAEPDINDITSSFSDVVIDSWYDDAVNWASANGVVNGYENSKFGPNDYITREQIVAILYRYSELKGYDITATGDISAYSDSGDIHDYALTPIKWALGNGLLSGRGNGVLAPSGNATRAEVATIIMRFYNMFLA